MNGEVSIFLISALRAIVEMLGLCLLGQGILHILAGQRRADNRIYQLFCLLTKAPREIVATLLPASATPGLVARVTFVMLLLLWLGLAYLRNSI